MDLKPQFFSYFKLIKFLLSLRCLRVRRVRKYRYLTLLCLLNYEIKSLTRESFYYNYVQLMQLCTLLPS